MAWWSRNKGGAPGGEAGADMPLIRLEGITKVFKGDADEETRALQDVTADIGRGEYISVSGPSGCGKSTFLSILALLDSPTSGRLLAERPPSRSAPPPGEGAAPQPRDRAHLPELQPDWRHERVGERRYPLALRNANPADRKARVEAALERVGLTARAKQRPRQFSGGHQQLVAIARAIAGRPPILLADEPTGNLDSKAGDDLMQMLGELHADGATVCIATHNPRYIALARRHIYLFDGRSSRSRWRSHGRSLLVSGLW